MNIIEKMESVGEKANIEEFQIGDTVDVHFRIVEGDKERIQVFRGTVIVKKGSGIRENFTVRRLVQGEGVERTFPVHSPKVEQVKIIQSGKVRRAKLFYLRDRVGKATKVAERKVFEKRRVKRKK